MFFLPGVPGAPAKTPRVAASGGRSDRLGDTSHQHPASLTIAILLFCCAAPLRHWTCQSASVQSEESTKDFCPRTARPIENRRGNAQTVLSGGGLHTE